ncbi:hypothetical protein EO98_03755 [Methanosarcina sp. 2.H.T.1A.6]|uniref:ABC transporter substrate-binding protein n=1 Tax=unclassified Methanosarcina TaxID=2644672 RepID=UPI0006224CB0|nr:MULTISPECIES: ABC transporter substrate-binding protein [unclassified Methanosarcina]KKG14866.1 hypothetical protein EO97_07030 [Methanosarcina sp. 2.H.T.1A.15]KKG19031.1 hypothetical protein EO94_06395 [Methanosarcina sp. 2.H.T.1A.3]KKG20839.1 hypothetical protein EO98_03755 [Methanosarcina sp. 2.H.T.1A.6]KKG22236.1 hypothetical protein EO96_06700 [Methanosarcina sp. 2.H.T.1A.8]
MKKYIYITFLLVTGLCLVFSGCITQDEPEDTDTGAEITLTDLSGRQVMLHEPANRIILQDSGAGGAFYTLFALDGKDAVKRIVGMDTELSDHRKWIWQKYVEAIPELDSIPTVGNGEDLNVESVIALKPDVLIVPEFRYNNTIDVYRKVEEAGIPVVIIDFHSERPETHRQSIEVIGKVIGREDKAAELANFYQEQIDEVTSRLEKIDTEKPAVYIECGMKGPSELYNTYGTFMWGALVENCRGENIANGVIDEWGPLNPEYLLDKNPDVIIFTGSYWPAYEESLRLGYYSTKEESEKTLDPFTERAGWETINAVKSDRIYAIHHGLARDIWDFVAIQFIAKSIYPEEFKDLDPEANLKKFHEEFLPVEYSGVWSLQLGE